MTHFIFHALLGAVRSTGYRFSRCIAAMIPAVLCCATMAAQIVQIPVTNDVNPSFQTPPEKSNHNYSYTQQLYYKSEINTSGAITKIRFHYYGNDGVPASLSNSNEWVIYIGHTTRTHMQAGFVPVSGLTQVFSGTIPANPAVNWVDIQLTTPFNYNNVDNLVIAVDENKAGNNGMDEDWFDHVTGSTAIYCQAYSATNIDPANPPIPNLLANGRPIVQLFFNNTEVVSCIENPTFPALGALVCPGPVTLSWPADPNAASYDLYFSASGQINESHYIGNFTGTTYTTSALSNGFYRWVALPRNGAGRANCIDGWFFQVVTDFTPPDITCPANITQSTTLGVCGQPVTYPDATATDNCTASPTVTRISGPASGSTFPVGITTIVYRASDANTSATCSFTVTVNDTQAPTIVCPAGITRNADAGQCTATVTYGNAQAGDNCTGFPTVTRISGPLSGAAFPVGTTSVIFRATDGVGNSSTCALNVTVNDTQQPSITCPANTTAAVGADCSGQMGSYSAASVSDNCTANPSVNQFPPAGTSLGNIGYIHTLRLTATDGSGNTRSCTFTVTTVAAAAPAITCPANVTVNAAAQACTAVLDAYEPASVSGACGTPVITQTPMAGTTITGYVTPHTITLRATDGNGNSSSCNFTVTLRDVTPPVITCPANISVDAAAGMCGANVSYNWATATDNCSGSVTVEIPTTPSGSFFPAGTTILNFQARDVDFNLSTCSLSITVRETQAPTIVCPANTTVSTGQNCTGMLPAYSAVSVTDNCGTPTVTQTPAAGTVLPTLNATQTITLRATDNAGNNNSCTFTVTLRDDATPVIACPDNATVSAGPNCTALLPAYLPASASDNCGVPAITQTPVAGTILSSLHEPQTITLRATDNTNNSSTCTFTVTLTDDTKPVITCPGTLVVQADLDVCGASVTYTANVTAIDNCSNSITITPDSGNPPSGSFFTLGARYLYFTAYDGNGNSDRCNFAIIVEDKAGPVITCPENATVSAGQGCTGILPAYSPVSVIDNCGTVMLITQAPVAGTTLSNINAPQTITLTATDNRNNTGSCTFTVTLKDETGPSMTCPADISVDAIGSACGANVTYGRPTNVSDNCLGERSITNPNVLQSGAYFPVGNTTLYYIAGDANGNTTTCSFRVTVRDVQAPTLTCPANKVLGNSPGKCGLTSSSGLLLDGHTRSDNCSDPEMQFVGNTPLPGTLIPIGTSTVTLRARDLSNNETTCSYTITVTDTEAPAITCPANISQLVDPYECKATVSFSIPTATDNCTASPTVTRIGGAAGPLFSVGVTYMTYRATDASGNSATCSFSILVYETEPPTIFCPDNIVQDNTPDQCNAIVTYPTPTASDNCMASPIISRTGGLASGSVFPPGITTVVFRARDLIGNSSTCSFTVRVRDVQAPTITCPDNVVRQNTPGQCGANVSFSNATATDNCVLSPTIANLSSASGSFFSVGTTNVTFRATDSQGNSATCSFTVTVQDTQALSISCPANISQANSPGQCGANVTFSNATATDNCTASPIVVNLGAASGSFFPIGTTSVTFRATDALNNSATCSFTITVIDTEAPAITCPANITQANTTGQCGANVTFSNATATDNCTAAPTVVNLGAISGSFFAVGTTSVAFRATDAAGNSATCSFTVTVNDTQAPTITCPANISQPNTTGQCGTNVAFNSATATDNCTVSPNVVNLGATSGTFFSVGTTSVTFRVTDAANNSATCAFTVTVNDTQAPTITCPANITQPNTTGQCGTIVPFSNATATDNCTASPTVVNLGTASGSSFAVGTTSVTFRATDAAGNSATCSFAVTVNDTQAPTITCPANITQANTTGQCGANVTFSNATATDNCTASSTIVNLGAASGTFFAVGSTSVTFRATDAAGNSATCSFVVTVNDTQAPTITCPANITQANTTGQCGTNVTFSSATSTDNCTASPTVVNLGTASGSFFAVGTTSVTFRATDAAGNSATCSFAVTVNDTQAPTITCPANITQANTTAQCGANVTFSSATATDNCTASPTVVNLGAASGSFFAVGTSNITFRATDAANNSATCSFTVAVVDAAKPVIVCPGNQTVSASASCSGTVGAWTPSSLSDNCTTVNFVQTPAAGTILSGHNDVEWVTLTAIDAAGNTATCTFSVTLQDVTLPVAKCKNATINLGANGSVTLQPSVINNVSTDNCTLSLSTTPATFTCINVGTNIVTLRATDGGGNTSTCTAIVTVKDVSAPTAVCQTINVFLNANGQASITPTQVGGGSSDACGIATMTLSKSQFNCSNANGSPVSVALTIKDVNNNQSTCTAQVYVKDNIAPTANCVDRTVVLSASGSATVQTAPLASGSGDNCSVTSYSPVSKVYTTANLGMNNLTITVKDFNNNSATCVSKITVLPYGSSLQVAPSDGGEDLSEPEHLANKSNIDLSVFPNPTSGEATLKFQLEEEQPYHLRLLDLNGRLIMETDFDGYAGENSVVLELGNQQAGIYVVEVQSVGMWGRKKLVLQK